jgi:hypothetical protein
MRAQVATFAGCPIPSQFGSRQAPKKKRFLFRYANVENIQYEFVHVCFEFCCFIPATGFAYEVN